VDLYVMPQGALISSIFSSHWMLTLATLKPKSMNSSRMIAVSHLFSDS